MNFASLVENLPPLPEGWTRYTVSNGITQEVAYTNSKTDNVDSGFWLTIDCHKNELEVVYWTNSLADHMTYKPCTEANAVSVFTEALNTLLEQS